MTRWERNEAALKTLHPQCAVRARLLLKWAEDHGMAPLIVQAYRSFKDQQRIYLSGAQAAPPGHSYHELRLAFDLLDISGGKDPARYDEADWAATDYNTLAAEAEALGLVAGHRWTRKDSPHFEYHPGWSPRAAHLIMKLADEDARLPDNFFDDKEARA